MGYGMPSAHGIEWKGRMGQESRKKFDEGYDKIFPEKKPWYEVRDEKLICKEEEENMQRSKEDEDA